MVTPLSERFLAEYAFADCSERHDDERQACYPSYGMPGISEEVRGGFSSDATASGDDDGEDGQHRKRYGWD